MKIIIVSILILVTLVYGQHTGPAKRAILGHGYGKIEVESIGKSVEVLPHLGVQYPLYLSPPIRELPIQESNIQQPTINHLEPPYPAKGPGKHHIEPSEFLITSSVQSYPNQEQKSNNPDNLHPNQNNGIIGTSSSSYKAEGYLPPAGSHQSSTQTQNHQYQNHQFSSLISTLHNQPTYKDYIAKTQAPPTNEEYYKAPGYLPPKDNPPSLKLNPVVDSPFLQTLQQINLPPSSKNKVVFPQSGSAPGYLPPTSLGKTTTYLLPVKDNYQISQQGYTEAFVTKNLQHSHEYAAPDYLPPNNQPLTPQNSHLQVQPNIYGEAKTIHPPNPLQLFPNLPRTDSTPELLNRQRTMQQKDPKNEPYSTPGYLPPQENIQNNKPVHHGSTEQFNQQHHAYSAAGYLPPNQSENSDPTDIDIRIAGEQTSQTGNNEHSGYDYAKPNGPAFHDGQSQNGVQKLIDESQNTYQNHKQPENTQVQTIKIIRENPNGKQESVRTVQIIAGNDQSNGIRTIKILQNSEPVDNIKTIKFIDYSSASNNGYLPPRSIETNNYSPKQPSSQIVKNLNDDSLLLPHTNLNFQSNSVPSSSSATKQSTSFLSTTNNGYLPPQQESTKYYSLNSNDENIRSSSQHLNLQPSTLSLENNPIQAPLSVQSSNNGYLPPNNQPLLSTPGAEISNYYPSQTHISHPNVNNYLPPNPVLQSSQSPEVEIIKIISEHHQEDPAFYASVAAANINNIQTIQVVNGRNSADSIPSQGYQKTRLLRFYRRF